MQPILLQIHSLLIKSKKSLAVAESCTGGLLSLTLTSLSGSSRYFILGIVTYSNKAKEKMLKVPAGLIRRKGAVSREIAIQMARNIRKIAKTDLGIGITGIAGPTGGSPSKPVGTVFIAVAGKDKIACRKFIFKNKSRINIRKNSVVKALRLLKSLL